MALVSRRKRAPKGARNLCPSCQAEVSALPAVCTCGANLDAEGRATYEPQKESGADAPKGADALESGATENEPAPLDEPARSGGGWWSNTGWWWYRRG